MLKFRSFRGISILVLTLFVAWGLSGVLNSNAYALSDIAKSKNFEAIKYLNENGVIDGYPDGTFKPNSSVSRAELMKIVVEAVTRNSEENSVGSPVERAVSLETYKNCFPDVLEDWYAKYVCYGKIKGWIGGYPDGTFKPANPVNKVEAIKIIVEAFGLDSDVARTSSLPFSDTVNGSWYIKYLKIAHLLGILEQASGSYGVAEFISRGEVSENIYRTVLKSQAVKKNPNILGGSNDSDSFDSKTEIKDEMVDDNPLPDFSANELVSGPYKIVHVVDGDTADVMINGVKTRLRLIGMDTPETVDPRKPVQCFGREASNKAKELLLNKSVFLEADPSQGELDKYQRLLRYIILLDGTNFNKKMIEDGYAFEYTFSKPYKYQTEFKQAQQSASQADRGLWHPDACNGESIPAIDGGGASSGGSSGGSGDEAGGNANGNSGGGNEQDGEHGGQISGYTYKVSVAAKKYYYCETDSAWKSLKAENVLTYFSEAELLADFPGLVLKKEC